MTLDGDYMEIKLKKIRFSMNMTLKELSELSGVSINTLSEIENGKDCKVSTLCKIANATGAAVCQLVDCDK